MPLFCRANRHHRTIGNCLATTGAAPTRHCGMSTPRAGFPRATGQFHIFSQPIHSRPDDPSFYWNHCPPSPRRRQSELACVPRQSTPSSQTTAFLFCWLRRARVDDKTALAYRSLTWTAIKLLVYPGSRYIYPTLPTRDSLSLLQPFITSRQPLPHQRKPVHHNLPPSRHHKTAAHHVHH